MKWENVVVNIEFNMIDLLVVIFWYEFDLICDLFVLIYSFLNLVLVYYVDGVFEIIEFFGLI